MDAFQGCYKFEPYDCRYWAAFYLFLRIAVLAIFANTQGGFFALVVGILLIPVIMMTVIIRPYRRTVYNVVEVVLLLALTQVFFSAVGSPLCAFDERFQGFVDIMLISGLSVPILYFVALIMYKIVPKVWNMYVKKLAQHMLGRRARRFLSRIEEDEDQDPLLQQGADSLESEN